MRFACGAHLLVALFLLAGCGEPTHRVSPKEPSDVSAKTDRESNSSGPSVLRLATTTSTRDSGLLDALVPVFEKASACRVDVIAVGTGAALKLGESGDVDAVLVHARSAEEAFMNAGHGIRHEPVMHNFFLIAGPADDPARARGRDAAAALKKIAAGEHRFVSRGDDSGTHKRERSLWKTAGGQPEWEGYVESGQGMGPSLVMADEMNAYVLTDEGTWLKQSGKFRLVPLVTEAAGLRNPYSVMVVNPDKHPSINSKLAGAFVDFLISAQGQQLIAEYRINGQVLFYEDRLEKESSE
ncbi:MAG: substrate-binding domain-containing protein [Planctomycetes bacterium]|nr:substrate-binding domain-containing protein [Planctomycetota bacterium]MBL7039949.1 substrate-binding domain-containing protein [Pirellulaceae bacterium]